MKFKIGDRVVVKREWWGSIPKVRDRHGIVIYVYDNGCIDVQTDNRNNLWIQLSNNVFELENKQLEFSFMKESNQLKFDFMKDKHE